MPTIPKALLKQIYRRGSLHNEPGGYSFAMRNHLAPAYIVGLRLLVDGAEVPCAMIEVEQSGATVAAERISSEGPLRFATGVDTVVRVRGAQLAPGRHALQLTAETREIGPAVIAVTDECPA